MTYDHVIFCIFDDGRRMDTFVFVILFDQFKRHGVIRLSIAVRCVALGLPRMVYTRNCLFWFIYIDTFTTYFRSSIILL